MTKQTEELLNLIKENPDLPIIPMNEYLTRQMMITIYEPQESEEV